jgi:hypothetical protein
MSEHDQIGDVHPPPMLLDPKDGVLGQRPPGIHQRGGQVRERPPTRLAP